MIIEDALNIPADYQYKAYNSKNIIQRNWHRNKFEAVRWYLGFLNNNEKKKVLDIGTGSGNFELYFNQEFEKIYGFDYNQKALDFLKGKLQQDEIDNVEIKQFDLNNVDASEIPNVDLTLMADVIEHISEESAIKFLKALKEKISDFGKIIILTPNYSSAWLFIEKILDKLTIVPKFDGAQHIARYDVNTLSKLLEKCGYEEVYGTSINTLSYLFPWEKLSRFLNFIELRLPFKHGNLVFSVFEPKTTKEQRIHEWNTVYADDQQNLYKNFFIKFIFDQGHRYIGTINKTNKVVMDFGSGIGYHAKFEDLSVMKKYLFADQNQKMLEKLSKIYNRELVIKVDRAEIPVENKSVDIIISSHVFEHIPDIEKTIKEIKRILKTDGKIMVVLPCDPGFMWNSLTKISPSQIRLKMNGLNYREVMEYEHVNTFVDIKAVLEKHFTIEDERYGPFGIIKNKNANLIYMCELSNKLSEKS